MSLVSTKEMFEKAYQGGYAIGAFNVNNMEIVQGITEAAKLENSPVILQVSAGARKYAKHNYLIKLVEAESLSTVWYIEFSNHLVADSVAEAAGAETAMFHSCHNVAREDLEAGATYLSLMRGNLSALKEHMR